jgi:cell division protein FtsW (lipid II flippase)
MAAEPNWLNVIGLVFMIYAFGMIALSAAYRAHPGDARAQAAVASQQRTAWAFAGITGMIGVILQTAGQFLHLPESPAAVLVLLSLVMILLGFVVSTFRTAEASRILHLAHRPEGLKLAATGSGSTFGQAAE